MRLGLVAAGANIAAISLVALVYGILSNSNQVVGISLSGVLAGIALMGAGASPPSGPSITLKQLSKLLLNTVTSIGEQLDLNDATLLVTMKDRPLLLITKDASIQRVDPGIGATQTSTYIAMPLYGILEELNTLPQVSPIDLRNSVVDLLVSDLGVARLVEVDLVGEEVRVAAVGVPEEIAELEAYPIAPLTALIMIGIARLTGNTIKLVRRERTPEGYYWIFEMVNE